MRKLVFATNNAHKLREIRQILGDSVEIVSLADIGCHEEIPETRPTIEGNARQKAEYVRDRYGADTFADDTGLEVEALGGAPGVHTARYAMERGGRGDHDSDANVDQLLADLRGEANRRARFVTYIALATAGGTEVFEGVCPGEITAERRGTDGFGYDPIFRPEGYGETFAEMGAATKNKISHRAKAVALLAGRLRG